MDEATTPVIANGDEDVLRLGEQIKARRAELGLTLRDVAASTGLSATFLSSLERGIANPTLESLRKVSNALNTPILRLSGTTREPSLVVRADSRRHLTLPPRHIRYELLTPTLTRKMVIFQVRATAEDGNLVVQPLSEPTEECVVVLSGQIRVCIAGEEYELGAGDSVYFEGRHLESITVSGPGEGSYISAITPPVF